MVSDPLINDYLIPEGCCDELLDGDGRPKPHVEELVATLRRLVAARTQRSSLESSVTMTRIDPIA